MSKMSELDIMIREAAEHTAAVTSAELSERRKSDRGELARLVVDLADRYRLAAWHNPEQDGTRKTSVDVAAGHGLKLTVGFDGNASHRPAHDTYVLSWHGVKDGWRLCPGAFSDVNPYHGGKATDVVFGTGALLALLERRFAAIADGSAFVQINGEAK